MKKIFDGFNYFLRLEKGEHLAESLITFATQEKVQGAWVSGIGGAQSGTIGFYDLEAKQYNWREFTELHEVTSLQGNIYIGEDGKPALHLHGTFADKTYKVYGGHVKDLVVGATLEFFIHRSDMSLRRKFDQDIGLPLLDLPNANA